MKNITQIAEPKEEVHILIDQKFLATLGLRLEECAPEQCLGELESDRVLIKFIKRRLEN